MHTKNIRLFIVVFLISIVATANAITKRESLYHFEGRIENLKDGNTLLIGAASSVTFEFTGANCEVFLQSVDTYEHHNYVVFVLDGVYLGRFEIKKGALKSIPVNPTTFAAVHRLTIYKATEAAVGTILFAGTTAKLRKFEIEKKKKVEFIGDSITCGMGNDNSLFPCGKGQWYDNHNAYMAYGPQLARVLDFDFVLSSVSGIGMYRNWNDENKYEATMPDVYANLYLNKNDSKRYNFNFKPDLVSIFLGTNDLSNGDGKKERLPFNEDEFVAKYIDFIKTVYVYAPKTRIVLLSSPMLSAENNKILVRCLNRVIAAFEFDKKHKTIALVEFEPMKLSGCGSHPDSADHTIIANQLENVFQELLNYN